MKLESLFPVQKQVIPVILNQNKEQSIYPNDMCILAPTGSGKTLTYVLPIVNMLKNRLRPCVKCIVLLPVSDLAEQVFQIFQSCINNNNDGSSSNGLDLIDPENKSQNSCPLNLKCALLTNKIPFAKEQAALISQEHGGKCLIDIIVATPGRLVDHIQKTKGLDLTQLSYLVLDECDRIIDEIKQNWLPIMMQAIHGEVNNHQQRQILNNENLNVHNLIMSKEKLIPFQKILLSATLTRNPEKLEQMKLFNPIFFKGKIFFFF
jgi:ATP-dependent RNA helicase DDX51/DBP6